MDSHGCSSEDSTEQTWSQCIIDRTVQFELKEIRALAPQKNAPGEMNRQRAIDRQHIGDTSVRALLRSVQHGVFKGIPAALVSFEFFFIFDQNAIVRFTRADICFRTCKLQAPNPVVLDSDRGKPPKITPLEVSALCPRKIYGNPTREDRRWKYGIAVPIAATLGVMSLGVTPSAELESAYPKDHRLTISGFGVHDGARWIITENEKQKSGIPTHFTCAMVVPYAGTDNFTLDVSITLNTNWPTLKLFSLPWNKDDPIHCKAGYDLGQLTPVTDFQELTDDHWRALVEYPSEFQASTQHTYTAEYMLIEVQDEFASM